MMTARREAMFWMENKAWYRINEEKDCFELTEEAPERAVRSFEMWKELQKTPKK